MTGADLFLDPLWGVDGVRADFTTRVPGVAGSYEKSEVIAALRPFHERSLNALGFGWSDLRRAEQVHEDRVAVVGQSGTDGLLDGFDGLVTADSGVCLGIYVADCAAIYLVDKRTKALGLLHSGRKGSEANIVGQAVEKMKAEFGTRPEDLIVTVSPCIRPPDYEVDFAAMIRQGALDAGVAFGNFYDCGVSTSDCLTEFYSYRVEQGKTGRMLALLGRID